MEHGPGSKTPEEKECVFEKDELIYVFSGQRRRVAAQPSVVLEPEK